MSRSLVCIIAGSREGIRYEDVVKAIEGSGWGEHIGEVVSGHAVGADTHGERWSREVLHREPTVFPYLSHLGKAGGPARNRQMAQYAASRGGYCILVPYNVETSRGTYNMRQEAARAGLRSFVFEVSTGHFWWEDKGYVYGYGRIEWEAAPLEPSPASIPEPSPRPTPGTNDGEWETIWLN